MPAIKWQPESPGQSPGQDGSARLQAAMREKQRPGRCAFRCYYVEASGRRPARLFLAPRRSTLANRAMQKTRKGLPMLWGPPACPRTEPSLPRAPSRVPIPLWPVSSSPRKSQEERGRVYEQVRGSNTGARHSHIVAMQGHVAQVGSSGRDRHASPHTNNSLAGRLGDF